MTSSFNSRARKNPYFLAKKFLYKLCEELEYHKKSREYLSLEQFEILRGYYSRYSIKNVDYYGHYYSKRIETIINFITKNPSVFILDAGCGVGSESIFFGLLGANVLGIDLSKKRLDIAKARIKYYENKYRIELNIKFILENILNHCERKKYDYIWAHEFISHVYSIEKFLKFSFNNLKTNGYLVISDSNLRNPYVGLKAWLVHRKGGLYTSVLDPKSLELIPYARERLFSASFLKNLCEENGFKVYSIQYFGYIPHFVYIFKFAKYFDYIGKIPLLKSLGACYTIIGKSTKKELTQ